MSSHNTKDVAHTDISADSFIDRFAPKRLLPYLKLARVDRPIGTWLLLFPGWWAIVLASGGFHGMGAREWSLMGLFLIGAFFMRGAGCTINDLWDRDLDDKVERTRARPLPSGALTVKQAIGFLIFQLLCGLVILMQMNTLTIYLGFFSLIPITIYPLMKRVTWWPQLFLGLTFNWSAVMGWTAVTGSFDWPVYVLYGACICWTLGYDTIYAHQDKEDDQLIGIKSTALLWGEHSKKLVTLFYLLAFTGLVTVKLMTADRPYTASILFLLPAIQMMMQVKRWHMDDQMNCLKTFKSNKRFGFLVLLAYLA